jgi:protein-S-isoprenylcysteine O-methyltransferase Ste14
MHAVGLHSALAIKRQRKRREEQRRTEERRCSSQSDESGLTSPGKYAISVDRNILQNRKINEQKFSTQGMMDSKVVTSVGMLHVGVVFLVLGMFLFISGIMPSDFTSWESKVSRKWWNELIAIGIFSIIVGCFLIILNRIVVKREENDLEAYVQCQLTRCNSGNMIQRDLESGSLNVKCADDNKFKNTKSFICNTLLTMNHSQSQIKSSLHLVANNQNSQPTLILEQISE